MGGKYTEAQKRASERYQRERVEDIRVRVPIGEKAKIQAAAAARGESLNAFIVRTIREAMAREDQ